MDINLNKVGTMGTADNFKEELNEKIAATEKLLIFFGDHYTKL